MKSSDLDTTESQLHALIGREVRSWFGVEMAVREVGPCGLPVFHDPSVPYLQFLVLVADLGRDGFLRLATRQWKTHWSLYASRSLGLDLNGYTGIFRQRMIDELPIGQVTSLEVLRDPDGGLEAAHIQIGNDLLHLIAGEVYEESNGTLRIQLGGDESVLARVTRGA